MASNLIKKNSIKQFTPILLSTNSIKEEKLSDILNDEKNFKLNLFNDKNNKKFDIPFTCNRVFQLYSDCIEDLDVNLGNLFDKIDKKIKIKTQNNLKNECDKKNNEIHPQIKSKKKENKKSFIINKHINVKICKSIKENLLEIHSYLIRKKSKNSIENEMFNNFSCITQNIIINGKKYNNLICIDFECIEKDLNKIEFLEEIENIKKNDIIIIFSNNLDINITNLNIYGVFYIDLIQEYINIDKILFDLKKQNLIKQIFYISFHKNSFKKIYSYDNENLKINYFFIKYNIFHFFNYYKNPIFYKKNEFLNKKEIFKIRRKYFIDAFFNDILIIKNKYDNYFEINRKNNVLKDFLDNDISVFVKNININFKNLQKKRKIEKNNFFVKSLFQITLKDNVKRNLEILSNFKHNTLFFFKKNVLIIEEIKNRRDILLNQLLNINNDNLQNYSFCNITN